MRNAEAWQRELQFAAVGVMAAVVVETGASARGRGQESGAHRLGWLVLAGGIATAYAHLVPRDSWGLRSGAAFAQLPFVSSLHRHGSAASAFKLAAWGALTGLALHYVPLPDPALPLPRR